MLPAPVPEHGYERFLVPGRLTARHDLLDLRTHNLPDVSPVAPSTPPQSERAPSGALGGGTGVIVELDQLPAPPDHHWLANAEDQPHRNAQALWPGLNCSERRRRPVM